MTTADLIQALARNQNTFARILPFDFDKEGIVIDLSDSNEELEAIDPCDTAGWQDYIWRHMEKHGARVSAGGYREKRSRYAASSLFVEQGQQRIYHMGIDIWTETGTPVLAPLKAQVHSFQNNQNFLDYGPTLILKHTLEGISFHTLYGHLTLESLENKKAGQLIEAGETFAEIGSPPLNGNWPPHLHFQIIQDMRGMKGDFQAIAAPFQLEDFLSNCPDPNLILGYQALKTK